jgi:hypothetical protein
MLKLLSNTESNSDNILEIKENLKNILTNPKEMNDKDDSIFLFYELLNIMIVCNDEPFKPFYNETISYLDLL